LRTRSGKTYQTLRELTGAPGFHVSWKNKKANDVFPKLIDWD